MANGTFDSLRALDRAVVAIEAIDQSPVFRYRAVIPILKLPCIFSGTNWITLSENSFFLFFFTIPPVAWVAADAYFLRIVANASLKFFGVYQISGVCRGTKARLPNCYPNSPQPWKGIPQCTVPMRQTPSFPSPCSLSLPRSLSPC